MIRLHMNFPLMVLVFGILALALIVFPGFTFAETTSGKDKAMWSWFPNEDILTDEAREEIITFAKDKGVNVIYLNTGDRGEDTYLEMYSEQYQEFIELAHENDIKVFALDGAAKWARKENHRIPIKRMLQVFQYNHHSDVDEQFDGMQFDIEPYLLDEWDTTEEREQLVQEYLKGLKKLNGMATVYGMKYDFEFMIAMPFWFDGSKYETTYEGVTKPLSDHVMDTVDYVALMAYRDFAEGRDSITYHIEHEIQYASENGMKAVIGVETQYLEPYEKVSFYEEGEGYMNEQLEIVDQLYSNESGYAGQAIHKYQSYKNMKP
ncbi:hypothetical protein [Alkalihalobacillus sp. TS-13]|uniref:hypothetical protein n=1 Tax=Alkalihalobacillus sp. TS-13 TaxID=2842455 RepID=UPI001C87FCC8|nr:hypothetical protein [Alkalihalobacillus sp. TS-13]